MSYTFPKPPGLDSWATLAPDRTPVFKVHAAKGHASNAFAQQMPYRPVQLLQMGKGEWIVVREYVPPDDCMDCGKRFNSVDYGRRYTKRSDKRRTMDQDIVCRECYTKDYNAYTEAQQRKRDEAELERLQTKLRKTPVLHSHIDLSALPR